MADSTLSLTYDDIRERIALERGYGLDSDAWSDEQTRIIEKIIRDGSNKFYTQSGHDWSFLKPVTEIVLPDGTDEVVLPADYGFLVGRIYFTGSTGPTLCVENDGKILLRRQNGSTSTGRPMFAAIVPSGEPGNTQGQRQKLMYWPEADQEYTILVRYSVLADAISQKKKYPFGGAAHAQTILEACLSASEQLDGVIGIHTGLYKAGMETSIMYDRRVKAQSVEGKRMYGGGNQYFEDFTVTYTP